MTSCQHLGHELWCSLTVTSVCSTCCDMQGKQLVAVAAAKRHMVVLSSEGDIYTWGHRVVTPRRVQLAGEQWSGQCTPFHV